MTLSLFEWYYNGIYYIGLEFSHSLPYHITEGSELSLINLVIRLSMTQFSSIQFNCSVVSTSLWPHGLQHTRLSCLSPSPGGCSKSCPLHQWCNPTISSSAIPFSSCLQSSPNHILHQYLQRIFKTDFLSDWLVGSPCCSPRDSQESSPTPQFKSINSLSLSFVYSPTLTSIHDYWKKNI